MDRSYSETKSPVLGQSHSEIKPPAPGRGHSGKKYPEYSHRTLRPNVAESVLKERKVNCVTQIMHTAEERVRKQISTRTAHRILPLSNNDKDGNVVRHMARGMLLAQRAKASKTWTDKWGVPKLSPANGVAHFVLPLQRLYFTYCSHRGDCEGMREYLTGQLAVLAKANPGVEIVVEPRWGSVPLIRGFYIGGHSKTVCVKNLKANEVHHKTMMMRNSSGMPLRKFRQHVDSFAPAIRPLWSPFHMLNRNQNDPLQPYQTTK
ncbi:mitochondrial ribosomal protein L51 / S25 / CI-B8 domain-containing protein [Paramicrosporidium saccamoebae]|uniref:Large ribosomal subunit protein mL43 n=1 Tax=Paramicrosporidium saccamoebae TaxID=1246581 RepID=A0A2H9TFT0_9FUNG|nr:mitochondrial ribosomal protein L51 / S25 / CI-B8 domain-containing protein [Paramicrosporidium saccamoebae]